MVLHLHGEVPHSPNDEITRFMPRRNRQKADPRDVRLEQRAKNEVPGRGRDTGYPRVRSVQHGEDIR